MRSEVRGGDGRERQLACDSSQSETRLLVHSVAHSLNLHTRDVQDCVQDLHWCRWVHLLRSLRWEIGRDSCLDRQQHSEWRNFIYFFFCFCFLFLKVYVPGMLLGMALQEVIFN